MLKKVLIIACIPLLLSVFCFSGKHELYLNLRFTKNHDKDGWKPTRTGFLWALSFLGAELPRGEFDKNIAWINDNTFRINLGALGFNDHAVKALHVIVDSLKKSEEYSSRKSIDLGEFLALTLGSSWHYYEITGVPKTLESFKSRYDFTAPETFPLTHSSVAKHNRILHLAFSEEALKQAYIAEEGEGDFLTGQFTTAAYEAFDIMPNGQLRFAIYDKEGNLMAGSPQKYSQAGKPAKCLWCHEIAIQPLFAPTDTLSSFISPAHFQERIAHQMLLLNRYRTTLKSDIDFTRTQDHSLTEQIYISFMEPSLERLSQEWNMPMESLTKILSVNATHFHEEFKFLGELYSRGNVSAQAPYKLLTIPGSIREENDTEPNFFK